MPALEDTYQSLGFNVFLERENSLIRGHQDLQFYQTYKWGEEGEPVENEISSGLLTLKTDKLSQAEINEMLGKLRTENISNISQPINLIYGHIQSKNFVSGSAGWRIDADGNLEGNSGTFRGDIAIGSGNSIFKADSNGIYLGNATFASAPFRVTMAGKITATNITLLSTTPNDDSGVVNEFSNFTSSTTGSGATAVGLRLCHIDTGTTANSTAILSETLPANGSFWDFSSADIDMTWRVYIDEDSWATSGDGKVYLKYGMGATADRGSTSDKVFGFELVGLDASDKITVVAFARNLSTIETSTLVSGATGFQVTESHNLRIKSDASANEVEFYIDGTLEATLSLTLDGTVATPVLTNGALADASGNGAEAIVNQVSYIFYY